MNKISQPRPQGVRAQGLRAQRINPKSFLLLAILIGVALRAWGAQGKQVISHDEAISYLGATANLGAYQAVQDGGAPSGQWAMTGEWQGLMAVGRPLGASLQTIAGDQANFDIHPPLYFWLLHLWIRIWGVHPWVGPALNILFFLVGAPALYGLAKYLLNNEGEAAAVTMIWAGSPAVLRTAIEARQYDLFGIFTILFVWLLARCLDEERPAGRWLWLLLGGIAAAGNLTHYHFVLVVGGGFLVFGWRQMGRDGRLKPSRRLVVGLGVVTAGYLLSFLLHPAFLTSFESLAGRQVDEAAHFLTTLDVLRRLYATINTFTGFWVHGGIWQLAIFILFLSGIVFGGLVYRRDGQKVRSWFGRVNWAGHEALLLYLWLGGITIVMYLTFISPIHAMTSRHMAAVWPFYAFLPVFLARMAGARKGEATGRESQSLLVGIAAAVVVFGLVSVWQTNGESRSRLSGLPYLETTPAILVDTVHRGVLPQFLIHAPADKVIFAASQSRLLEDSAAWRGNLLPGSLYLSDTAYGNTEDGRERILALLEEDFEVIRLAERVPGIGAVYLLEREQGLVER